MLIISVISDDVFFPTRLVIGGALESMGLIFINKIEIFGKRLRFRFGVRPAKAEIRALQ